MTPVNDAGITPVNDAGMTPVNDASRYISWDLEGSTTWIQFRNDTNIFIASETLEQATQLANTNSSHINGYMELNLLHINLDKSCFMYFPPKPKYLSTKHIAAEKCGKAVHIGQNAIKEVTEVKFLVVMLDPLINWNIQIQHLKKKVRTSFDKTHIISICTSY